MLPINVTTNITQASNSKACDARGILHKEGKYEKKDLKLWINLGALRNKGISIQYIAS